VLCKSVFATADTMSLAQNRQGPYTATSHFVIRKLYELHRFGADHVNATSIPDRPFVGKRRLYRTPTNLEMLQWLGRRARRRARGMLDRPKTQQWRVGLRRGGPFVVEAVAEGRPADLRGFTWLRNKSGSSYADPFLLRAENTTWLFVEEFVESTKRGRICVADLASHPESPSFVPCLEGPHHLSFPLVFEHDGEFYMIPESADAHEVALYRAERFPFRWVRHKMLLKGDFVDTVVWRDSQWWLLTTVREPVGYSVHALLFSAPALDAEWTRHPAGPLFNDVRTGRNAGAVVVSGGRRYRLSQDDSIVYGRAFQFNEMTRLDCERYEERPSARVEPFLPNMIGTHTYSRAGEWEAIDGCFLERR